MTHIDQPQGQELPGLKIIEDDSGLGAFLQPACAALLWHRPLPSALITWLQQLDAERLPTARVVLRPDTAKTALQAIFDQAQTPENPSRDWLQQDILRLITDFAELMACDYVRLRLAAVSTNSCRKFHRDAIRARLICTYRGTGTQYGLLGPEAAEPSQIFTAPTGAPMLLRGSLWPPEPQTNLLHRSPPIEGMGETRLLLVLDPILDPQREGLVTTL